MNIDQRVLELLELAESEGFELPYAPGLIVALEILGAVVDLKTGEIQRDAADAPLAVDVSPYGEAIAHLLSRAVKP